MSNEREPTEGVAGSGTSDPDPGGDSSAADTTGDPSAPETTGDPSATDATGGQRGASTDRTQSGANAGGARERGPNEQFCISCGEVISQQANICPDCGAPQDSPAPGNSPGGATGTTHGGQPAASSAERRFQQALDDKKVEGWDVHQRQGDRVILIKRRYGSLTAHIVLFVFTFYTFGLANLAYLAYKYFADADKMVLRRSEFQ